MNFRRSRSLRDPHLVSASVADLFDLTCLRSPTVVSPSPSPPPPPPHAPPPRATTDGRSDAARRPPPPPTLPGRRVLHLVPRAACRALGDLSARSRAPPASPRQNPSCLPPGGAEVRGGTAAGSSGAEVIGHSLRWTRALQ
ncbi:hypothetical protein GUJ93_ZPchr0005g14797 [Zizania palustris]|uniref:Uncharacterized protein n=1 Tax=Zizania palustris TaxID=103762 RepID=A0A8J5S360_ZIZPA|nr:hypothetical protein GUJ93_ZPchr0005g14797 [Zizania palustris]